MIVTLVRSRIAIAAIILCGLYLGYRIHEAQSEAASLLDRTLKDAVPTVAVVTPKPLPATESITLPGNIVGWYEAPIYARVTGYVKMWYKRYGDEVKKGDLLAEINTPDLDAEYLQAHADLESERAKYKLAEVTAKRWIALRPNHAVSEQSITVQEQGWKSQAAVVRAAEQKVKNIEAFIGFKKIVAPFDGVVIQRNINVGDLVSKEGDLSTPNAKSNLFTVAVVDKLRLFVNVPQTFDAFLRPGLTADVTVAPLPHRHFQFQFLTVAKGFDVSTRTATTIFTIENKDRALWPGTYAQVHMTAPIERPAFILPSSVLIYKEHGTQVAVVKEDDHLHLQPITVAKLFDNIIQVSDGIGPNDRVVNNPTAALLEDSKVRVVTPEPGYDLVAEEGTRGQEDPRPKEQVQQNDGEAAHRSEARS
ncbi:MAG: putative Co/Zn/Cd efflux system membrane fusion protein [Nitrospira sp.]|jgi:RND family efflux transporter MFP subunit|nr:MAG: putative Co/Zn/Cd efflux system membrane fusion protein [Nitrospira sp.]